MQARSRRGKWPIANCTDKTTEQNKKNAPTGSSTTQKKEKRKGQKEGKRQRKNLQAKTGQAKRQTRAGKFPVGETIRNETPSIQKKRKDKTDPIRHIAKKRKMQHEIQLRREKETNSETQDFPPEKTKKHTPTRRNKRGIRRLTKNQIHIRKKREKYPVETGTGNWGSGLP